MDQAQFDLPPIYNMGDPNYHIYFVKMITGESIIGKSKDTETEINENNKIDLQDIILVKRTPILTESGNVAEYLLLTPWLEGMSIRSNIPIPLTTIIAVGELSETMVMQYHKACITSILKEITQEKEYLEAVAGVDPNQPTKDFPKIDAPIAAPAITPKHEPDRVTPESLHRDTMLGDLIDTEEELQREDSNSDSEPPPYVRDGFTIH